MTNDERLALAARVQAAMEAKGLDWGDVYERYGAECVHIVRSRLEEPDLCPTLLEQVADLIGLDASVEIDRLHSVFEAERKRPE